MRYLDTGPFLHTGERTSVLDTNWCFIVSLKHHKKTV